MTGILDRLPASARHLLYSVIGTLAAWGLASAQADYTHWHLPVVVAGAVGAALPVIASYLLPITTQYGVGSKPGPVMGAGATAATAATPTVPPAA